MKKIHAGNKFRISVTLMPSINFMLEQIAVSTGESKSALVEKALKKYIDTRLEEEAKEIAKIKFEDVPSEDEWQSLEVDNNLWTWDE